MTFYCSQDGAGPMDPVDWHAAEDAIVASFVDDPPDSPVDAIQRMNAPRAACPSHFARNGNGPRTLDAISADVRAAIDAGRVQVVIGDTRDEFGGGVASLTRSGGTMAGSLRCPECLALARGLPNEAESATEENHE